MGEVIRLDEVVKLPLPPENNEFYEYARSLVGELEKLLGQEVNTTINILLDRAGNTLIYVFGIPDQTGEYATGTWRMRTTASTTDGVFTVEQYDGSDWVEKTKVTTDKLFTTGGLGLTSVTVDSDYTIPDNVYNVTVDTTSSDINITLPSITGKRKVRVSAKGINKANLIGTVKGSTSFFLFGKFRETADLVDDGTEWLT